MKKAEWKRKLSEGSNRGLTKFNLGRGSFGEISGSFCPHFQILSSIVCESEMYVHLRRKNISLVEGMKTNYEIFSASSLYRSIFITLGQSNGGKVSPLWRSHVPVRKRKKLRRSQKITDKIAALQKLVSPHGKVETASVLREAYNSIKALKNQIQNLCNTASNSDSLFHSQNSRGEEIGVQSRDFCLVPVSLVQKVTDEDVYDDENSSL